LENFLLKWLKNYKIKFRFSTRPHKQFLWFLLKRDSKLSLGKEIGLDAGCANMKNKRFFQTTRYIGLDPDPAMLSAGAKQNPDAHVLKCKILDAPVALRADFVQCIQVLVNADFEKKETLDVVKRLIMTVNKGGVLLINTGSDTLRFDDKILYLLKNNFEEVSVIKYGSLWCKKAPLFLSILIAIFLYLFPYVRTLGGHQKTYFRCLGKKQNFCHD
jgi:hypothetical protein